ncbi:3024_t:CDS:2 [Ambispora gerdemannii]|uniref:3024_t:CDS:1 n=1 Tax=Ambispora gerdemannii TaxID=144530 RepID=A0A9N9BIR3_9GLOM|nr:3024_t:CDS:2 [Ambispora gerdemannii]
MRNPFKAPQTSTKWEQRIRILTLLLLFGFLIYLYYLNIHKFTTANKRPFIESSERVQNAFHIPGLVVCGPNINARPKCAYGLWGDETKQECDVRWWKKAPLTLFQNVYPDAVGEEWYSNAKDCFVFVPPDSFQFRPKKFEELTVQIYSNETTTKASHLNRWVYFGIYWSWLGEDARLARVEYLNLPAKMSVTLSRKEFFQRNGVIQIVYDATTIKRHAQSFKNETNKWGEINLRPAFHPNKNGYVISVYREKPSFDFLDLLPALSSSFVVVVAIYQFFFGKNRLDPYGVMQKYVFHTAEAGHPLHLGSEEGGIMLGRIIESTQNITPPRTIASNDRTGFRRIRDDEVHSRRNPNQQPSSGDNDARNPNNNPFVTVFDEAVDEENSSAPPSDAQQTDVSERITDSQIEIASIRQEMHSWERLLRRFLVL